MCTKLGVGLPTYLEVRLQLQVKKKRGGAFLKLSSCTMDVNAIVDHHGILSPQYRAYTSVSTKKYPKILTFNKERAKFFVATILDDQTAFGPVLVDRKDGNITGINKGKAIERLSIALGRKDYFMVEGHDGQPCSGVNDKLVTSFVGKVFNIIDKVGIHVKKGVAHSKEKVSTGRVEPDHQLDWIPYEQMVAKRYSGHGSAKTTWRV